MRTSRRPPVKLVAGCRAFFCHTSQTLRLQTRNGRTVFFQVGNKLLPAKSFKRSGQNGVTRRMNDWAEAADLAVRVTNSSNETCYFFVRPE